MLICRLCDRKQMLELCAYSESSAQIWVPRTVIFLVCSLCGTLRVCLLFMTVK